MTLSGTYVPSKTQWVRENVEEYEATDGAEGGEMRGFPVVVITSVGAKSGDLRKNPVMRVERDGRYLAVASLGGSDDNPQWFHNVVAHPVVDLQDRAHKAGYTARRLEGDERADWWQHAVRTWPTYARVPAEDRAGDSDLPA